MKIDSVRPGSGVSINLNDLLSSSFLFEDKNTTLQKVRSEVNPKVNVQEINPKGTQQSVVMDLNYLHLNKNASSEKALLKYPIESIKKLERCTKCILPETFPFIYFNENGICNYCQNYKKQTLKKSVDGLMQLVEPIAARGVADVFLPFRGGKEVYTFLMLLKMIWV